MYHQIAEQLYNLLVVNSYAAAVQQDDGKYITKYFPLSTFIIEEMLKKHGSMGCYQQGYKNDRIKWICFDFDCLDKKNPDIIGLYKESVFPFTKILDDISISYMTEFSGRRGIHVWVIFDVIFPKQIGYRIVQELKRKAKGIFDNLSIHIDYYPATDSSKGNVVGKQVKFPLSCHRAGGRSFLFSNEFKPLVDCESNKFLDGQLQILENYKPNKLLDVEYKLGITEHDAVFGQYKYKKYTLVGDVEVPLDKIEEILSETAVYREIFMRMKQGKARNEDWTVLLGTLRYCDDHYEVVQSFFSTFPNYDVDKTTKNIEKLSDKYFPATFHYLYKLYVMQPEDWLDLDKTGLAYLFERLGCTNAVQEEISNLNEHINTKEVQYTLLKEKRYFLDNDEVPDILIWNRLNTMKPYDLNRIEEIVEAVKVGNWKQFTNPNDIIVYERMETEEKKRLLVSLSARDRVITTHLTLMLHSHLQSNWHSFSYNISPCSKDQIFYIWYSSWMNYITRVQTFLDVPFLDSFHVFVMDIKEFYDHIDFLSVYRIFEQRLEIEINNIMQFLIAYNENVMRRVKGNSRCGVPQGPAYARVIAEAYLDYILQSVLDRYDRRAFQFYRYVDDIVVYYRPEFDGEKLYHDLENTLLSFGLPLNQEKSSLLGPVKYLTERERKFISHKDKFSYELQINESSIIFEEEQNRRMKEYLKNHEFDISVVSYIFSRKVVPKAAEVYYRKYAKKIFSECHGRGSYFRKFYQFLFEEEKLVEQAIEKKYFMEIPVNSLNFKNFIHCLYLAVQNGGVSQHIFEKIREEYLSVIREQITNTRDISVIDALLMI